MDSSLTVVAGGVAGAFGGYVTAYLKERASWGSKAREGLLDATSEALSTAQDAKQAQLLLCKAQSRQEADSYIHEIRQAAKDLASPQGKVIIFAGPESRAVDALAALTTRLHVAADLVGVGMSAALQLGDAVAAESAADDINEQVDILDGEVSDFAAAMYLASELPILKRRWEGIKQRRSAKARARRIASQSSGSTPRAGH